MHQGPLSCLCLSSFNLDTFAGYLDNDLAPPALSARVGPYGQVLQVLADPDGAPWKPAPSCVLVWTRPQDVSESFADALEFRGVALDRLHEQVDRFAALLLGAAAKVGVVYVPSWTLPGDDRGLGPLELRQGVGPANALWHMNLRLAQRLSEASNVYLLDTQRWVQQVGARAFTPKRWYMAKVPFGHEVFKIAVAEIKSALRGLAGQAKKLVVVDLDDTLWGGIVGDAGWQNLVLGGHDPAGEAFVDFQRGLKALTRRGILLGIVSKNDEAVALEAIRRHPEMVLRLVDFAGWRINWRDKAQNLAQLVSELNLGIDSVVVIDDNPVERARIRETFPEVLVPDWPEDPLLYLQALQRLTCFDAPVLSAEDLARSASYVTERQRAALRERVGSVDDWLVTLQIRVRVEALNPANLPRTAQLLNKTNQMNLTTRRMSEGELAAWAAAANRRLWTFRVADKFGDSGLTGIVSLECDGDAARIVDFILSCRVMGRRVEETMLAHAVAYARSAALRSVNAVFVPTAKNRPCLEFWQRSGFAYDQATSTFHWDARRDFAFPSQITVESTSTD